MEIEDFVKKSIKQDKRNVFEEAGIEESIPGILRAFYQKANPIDVEITMDGNAIRFISADELSDIQLDYPLGNERFVFATCNGDPIYVYKNKIFTCCHGTNKIEDELIAEDFNLFLDMIDTI